MAIEIISVTTGIVGLVFGLYQYYRNSKDRRSLRLNELIFRLWSDEEIRSTIQLFEYDTTWYHNCSFVSRDTETRVDKTLQYLSYICYLKKQGVITQNEFNVFEYEISRLFHNRCVKEYLDFLLSFSRSEFGDNTGKPPFPFHDLLDFGRRNNYI